MPAKKKKTAARKKKQTMGSGITRSPLFALGLLLVTIFISVAALFRLGSAGDFLYQLGELLVGQVSWLLYLGAIALCVFKFWTSRRQKLPKRLWGAVLCLFAGLDILCTALTNPLSPWEPLRSTAYSFVGVLQDGVMSAGGLAGGLLYGICASLFAKPGAIIASVLCFGLAALFLLYGRKLPEKKEKPEKPRTREKKQPAPEPVPASFAIIDADVQDLSDTIDHPVEEIADSKPAKRKPKKKAEPEEEEPVSLPAGNPRYEGYKMPSLSLLDPLERKGRAASNRNFAKEQGMRLISILKEFSVDARMSEIHIGPSVTRFEIKPEMGVRVSKISNLQNDIQMALGAQDIRIEAPIPGKSAVGIEIPNLEKTGVQMKELMSSVPSSLKNQSLLFALGKDLQGENVYGRLDRMPHLLIAGATGSGKSVCVNSIICSLLMRTRPDEVKLVLIDPKKVEFTPYKDVPHLLAPVITDSDLANKSLKAVVAMMDNRYDLFGMCGVRNITSYNIYVGEHPEENLQPLPRMVVIIDELADLMLAGAKEVEQSIQRITQLARAAGIHLVVATQRPSVDVITGVIKANIPSRIAFAVSSAVDSRTILDQTGAERLLGYGDMLYLPNGATNARRLQGVFIQDEEVSRICDYVKTQGKPMYDDAFVTLKDLQSQGGQVSPEAADPLYNEVKAFVIQSRKASTSLIQRRFSIGYARAARLMDVLEQNGIIGPAHGARPREILVENTLES